jgi:hypothetical protein
VTRAFTARRSTRSTPVSAGCATRSPGAEGPRSLDQTDVVDALAAEYETLVGAVLDADAGAALAIDDPATRAGILLAVSLERRRPIATG